MSGITGDKMFSHIDRIVGDQKPITADIFLTNYCNNKCPYCTYGRWELDAGKSYMRYEDFVMYAERMIKLGVQTIINMYGEDSDVFRVRVAGDFPLAEDDIYIPLPMVEKSVQTEYIPREHPDIIHIGCDVARFGTDKTVIGYRTDEKVRFFKKRVGQDTMKTADDIALLGSMLVDQYKLRPEKDLPIPIKIDDGGVGGGVVDRLRQMKRNFPERFLVAKYLFSEQMENRTESL